VDAEAVDAASPGAIDARGAAETGAGAGGGPASGSGGTGGAGGGPGGSGGAAGDASAAPDASAADAPAGRPDGGDVADGPPGAATDASPLAPAPGAYGTRAPLLDPNSETAVAVVGTKIYVLGGYPSSRVPVDSLQIYDTVTNRWTEGARHPTTIHHPVLAGVGAKLYSLGGQITINGGDTGRSYEYDPTTNRWREIASMPTARGGGAAAVIDDRIYVVGGRPPAGNAFEVYSVTNDRWDKLPSLPNRYMHRNHLAAGAMGGKVYVAGGRYNGGGFGDPRTDALDMYDPGTNAWTSKKPMRRVRGGMSAVVAFGCFHVYGGEGQGIGEPNDVYPDHDVYDPRTDTWTALPKLPVPFHGVTGGAFVDGLIYMPGGGIRSGGTSGTRMHQVYRPAMRCE
jgi:N-acetylneuraminic acid mutarotase